MLSVLILGFLFVCQTTSLSVLTDDKPKSEDTKIDLTRQLLNQETMIRMNLDRKVYDLVRNMADMKTKMADMKTTADSNNKQLKEEIKEAKTEILALKHENIALKAELQLQSNETTLISDNLTTTVNNLKADVEQSQKAQMKLSSAVSSLEVFRNNMSSLSSYMKETRVGFTACVTSDSSSWSGDILVFPHVITNIGNGYSTSTGKFTASRAGTYVFFVTAVSYSSKGLSLDIVHNGTNKVRTLSTSYASYQTGTNLAVLELSQGDTVWVRRYRGTGYYSVSVPQTTFSGFLL